MRKDSVIYKISYSDAMTCLEQAGILVQKSLAKTACPSSDYGQIRTNSSLIQPADLFIAYGGVQSDGHHFIAKAVEQGSRFIVFEDPSYLEFLNKKARSPSFALVKNSRKAWSLLWAKACGNPEKNLKLWAVTGTNGKTSTVWMACSLLRDQLKNSSQKGNSILSLGTLGTLLWRQGVAGTPECVSEPLHTTPDPDLLFPILSSFEQDGGRYVFMEASSHSLVQEKLAPLQFESCAFTSFSRDHLDFHKNMEDYWASKCRLFTEHLKKKGSIFFFHGLAKKLKETKLLENMPEEQNIIFYGEKKASAPEEENPYKSLMVAEWKPDSHLSFLKFSYDGKTFEGEIPLLGDYAAENFLAAWLLVQSVSNLEPAPETWKSLPQVPGRLERVGIGDSGTHGPFLFVDFAHTPEGLEKVLTTLKNTKKPQQTLWLVFGCGGDRDRGKRPLMATIASLLADHIIVTSDNPRWENPLDILSEIRLGFQKTSSSFASQVVSEIVDREEAIKFAITNAQAQDIIVIAGKGHEKDQIIAGKKVPFEDQSIAKKYLTLRQLSEPTKSQLRAPT